MGYTVVFRESAEKEFDALSPGRRKALFQKLRLLEDNLAPPETVELRGYAPLRRIKAGDTRAIYDEPDARGKIFILRIGTDHDIYEDIEDLLDEKKNKPLPRPNWSRALPRPLLIPDVMVLATLADVRTLMQHLPADRRERQTWRQVAADIEAAAAGGDIEGAAIGLRMVLF